MKWFIVFFFYLFLAGFVGQSMASVIVGGGNIKTQSTLEDTVQEYCPQLEQIEQYFVCRGESTIEECVNQFSGQAIADLIQSVMKKFDTLGVNVLFCVKNPMCLWDDTISECRGQIEEATGCILEAIRGFHETHCLTLT